MSWHEWRQFRGQDEDKNVDRRRLIFVRTLDLALSGLVYVVVMVSVKMCVNEG
jgi:hypothetical protein